MIWAVWAKLKHLINVLEVNVYFTGAGAQRGGVSHQHFNRVRHSLGRIIVVVIHVHDDFSARFLVHQISFFSQRKLFAVCKVFYVGYVGVVHHQIVNFVGSVVDNDPLHSLLRVRLVLEAF